MAQLQFLKAAPTWRPRSSGLSRTTGCPGRSRDTHTTPRLSVALCAQGCHKALPHLSAGQRVSCLPGISALTDKAGLVSKRLPTYLFLGGLSGLLAGGQMDTSVKIQVYASGRGVAGWQHSLRCKYTHELERPCWQAAASCTLGFYPKPCCALWLKAVPAYRLEVVDRQANAKGLIHSPFNLLPGRDP